MPGLLVPCNYSVLNCCFLLLNKPMSEKVQEGVEREVQGWRGSCRDIWHQSCGNHQSKQTWLKNYIRAALPAVTNCSCKSPDVPPIRCPLTSSLAPSPTLPTLATASAAPVSWYVLSCYLVTLYGCTSYCCCSCCCCCPCGTNQSIEFLYPFLYCALCWFCALFN